ncbi:FG-GAP-like repeat-containing protein [Sorangium sp. So ce385]|uniref:FG-GAP-like repeat-containing protein n=1 Tax=Sorangium sp. So ce385 TaxID=3133308 RepID=UPI003F5B5931
MAVSIGCAEATDLDVGRASMALSAAGPLEPVLVDMQGSTAATTVTRVGPAAGGGLFGRVNLRAPSILHATSADAFQFAHGDVNGDGQLDLYAVKMVGAVGTELHVLDGATGYQSWARTSDGGNAQLRTPLPFTSAAAWSFVAGDWDGDARDDLIAIRMNGGSTTEVRVLTAASQFSAYARTGGTALHATDASGWAFGAGDVNGDGALDVYAIKRNGARGRTEVHVLDGAANLSRFATQTETALGATTADSFEFAVGDYDGDGRDDLWAIQRAGASGSTEVHVMTVASGFTAWGLNTATALPTTQRGRHRVVLATRESPIGAEASSGRLPRWNPGVRGGIPDVASMPVRATVGAVAGDASGAINAAILQAEAAGGGVVRLTGATYTLHAPIRMRSGVVLRGAGATPAVLGARFAPDSRQPGPGLPDDHPSLAVVDFAGIADPRVPIAGALPATAASVTLSRAYDAVDEPLAEGNHVVVFRGSGKSCGVAGGPDAFPAGEPTELARVTWVDGATIGLSRHRPLAFGAADAAYVQRAIKVASPIPQGAVSFDVTDDTPGLAAGGHVLLLGDNVLSEMDAAMPSPKCKYQWYDARARGQVLRVLSVTARAGGGKTVSVETPVALAYSAASAPVIVPFRPVSKAGLENVRIAVVADATSWSVNFWYAVDSWVRNVDLAGVAKAGVHIWRSGWISVLDSSVHDAYRFTGGGWAYGVNLTARSTSCLVMNNSFDRLRHAMILSLGANGNVLAYNRSTRPSMADMSLHGTYPYDNLFEGNVATFGFVDDRGGRNGPRNVYFRNRLRAYFTNYSNQGDPLPQPPDYADRWVEDLAVAGWSDRQTFIGNTVLDGRLTIVDAADTWAEKNAFIEPKVSGGTSNPLAAGAYFLSNAPGTTLAENAVGRGAAIPRFPPSLFLEAPPAFWHPSAAQRRAWPAIGSDVDTEQLRSGQPLRCLPVQDRLPIAGSGC